MIKNKRLHRWFGILLLLPLLGWIVTGAVFLIKPGYTAAYEILQVKTYPFTENIQIKSHPDWDEIRYLKTVLGLHLLVKINENWQQLDPHSLKQKLIPNDDALSRLFTDAIKHNKKRYGDRFTLKNGRAVTNTEIEITLDWNQMKFQQIGPDRKLISALYRIHYLQWTGNKLLDRFLALIALLILLLLTVLGLLLALKKPGKQGS